MAVVRGVRQVWHFVKEYWLFFRVLWIDATGQSEFSASAGHSQVQGRTLALPRRRDDILCQRRELLVRS